MFALAGRAGRLVLPMRFCRLGLMLALAPAIAVAATARPPVAAKDEGLVEGLAQLLCHAAADGQLSDCIISAETPANKGIGAMALRMASQMKISVTGEDSRPVGAQVSVPIHVVRAIKVDRGTAQTSPTRAQMAAVYPPDAARDKIKGRVELACMVTATGTPHNCWPASESPAGRGFGEAAMKLVPSIRFQPAMQFRPGTQDFIPTEGEMSLVLQFTPPR
ncbi:MAG: hypothetical protein JWM33_2364 [Caulobacteraceae bacterium]|nr:hypothetical protein [Caulobacteraceae bacterium]